MQCVSTKPRSGCKVFLKSRGLDLALYSKAVCNTRRVPLLSPESRLKDVVYYYCSLRTAGCPVESSET